MVVVVVRGIHNCIDEMFVMKRKAFWLSAMTADSIEHRTSTRINVATIGGSSTWVSIFSFDQLEIKKIKNCAKCGNLIILKKIAIE